MKRKKNAKFDYGLRKARKDAKSQRKNAKNNHSILQKSLVLSNPNRAEGDLDEVKSKIRILARLGVTNDNISRLFYNLHH